MKSTIALYVSLSLISSFLAVAEERGEPARPEPRFEVPDGHSLVWEEIVGAKYQSRRLACRKDGVLNGPGEEFFAAKDSWDLVRYGQYKAGKKHGTWVINTRPSNPQGRSENYENGELVHVRYFWAKDGAPIHDIPMRNGRPHGIKRSYLDERQLGSMQFHRNGMPAGPEIEFGPNCEVRSLKWNSNGVTEGAGAMAVSFHENGKLHAIGWQLEPGGHALSKFWAGPHLEFREDGTLYIEELNSNLSVLLYRKVYYPDGTLKAMLERHERKEKPMANPAKARETYETNVGNVSGYVQAALKVDTYTLRLWGPDGELQKSEEINGFDFYDAKFDVE